MTEQTDERVYVGPIQHDVALCRKEPCDCWCAACERHNEADTPDAGLRDPEPIPNETESGFARRQELVAEARAAVRADDTERLAYQIEWELFKLPFAADPKACRDASKAIRAALRKERP
jgi:hypothetical protein